jgi:hypothetical protein
VVDHSGPCGRLNRDVGGAGIDLKISSGVRGLEPSVVVGSWYALAARQAMCDASVEACSSSDVA